LSVNAGYYNEPAGICQSDGEELRLALSSVHIGAIVFTDFGMMPSV